MWLNPAAWILAAAIAAPIVIHLLVRQRARPFWFPSLRFVSPSRLASVRRRAVEGWLLLLVRAAILATAAAAFAGPFLVSASRRASWNARRAVAIVTENDRDVDAARPDFGGAFVSRTFTSSDLRDGVARAAAWLESVPPARREIVAIGSFARGSIPPDTFAFVPGDVGIRLVRNRALPPARTLPDSIAWRSAPAVGVAVHEERRTIELHGATTNVVFAGNGSDVRVPLVASASQTDRPVADAALAAALSHLVPSVPPHRAAVVVFAGAPDLESRIATARDIDTPWMADAGDRLANDPGLRLALAGAVASDDRVWPRPWHPIVVADEGRPLVAIAADGPMLIVATATSPRDGSAPVLLRSVLEAIALTPVPAAGEILPMSDADLRAFERPSGEARPRLQAVESDDRGWAWAAALALLTIEWLVRRSNDRARQRDRGARARVA